MSVQRLVIATRRSRLALWQAEHIKSRLSALQGAITVELLPLSTRGDELIDRRLGQVGGKGLFVKELEQAMAEGPADLAVHSMKDVPAELPEGFMVAAITLREDPRDAFVSGRHASPAALPAGAGAGPPPFVPGRHASPAALPAGAVLGTSSLRRGAQLRERYPSIEVRLLRGNVDTRLAKLDRGDYDAIVLAVAGLLRLGLAPRIRAYLSVEESLPAPGQGALGIECLRSRSDVAALLAPLADHDTARCVRAERAVSRILGGSCALPLGAY